MTGKKITRKATAQPPTEKKPAVKPASVQETLKLLDEQLATYAPKRHAKLKGSTKLDRLAKLVEIPDDLRQLWAWANGVEGLIVIESRKWLVDAWVKNGAARDDYPGALDLLSIKEAETMLKAILDSEEDQEIENARELKLIPFAAEQGSGDCLVLDARGRVLYWNHEEPEELEKEDASLAKLLGRTVQAIQKRQLFGGAEPLPRCSVASGRQSSIPSGIWSRTQ